MQVFMSAEVLGALAGTLFPKPASSSQDSSGASTPADEVIILIRQDALFKKEYFRFSMFKELNTTKIIHDIFLKSLLYKFVKFESIFMKTFYN